MPTVIDKIADALHIPHKHHEEQAKPVAEASSSATPAVETASKPVFDSAKVTVIFVLGGPGAGAHRTCYVLDNA